jgi:uncharacterized protein
VSKGSVRDPGDPRNSRLFRHGTLYVARFDTGGTGEWLPLALDTPTHPNLPSEIVSGQIAEQGVAEGEGAVPLPKRAGIAGQNESGGRFDLTIDNEAEAAPDYQNKTLRDFYPTQGAILCDAFLASNLIGGTPTSRPEDCELHPLTKDLYLAQTDGAPGSDGYPDSRIFVVAKYTSAIDAAQQSGDLIRITEDSPDGAGQTFTWAASTARGGTLRQRRCPATAMPMSTTWRSTRRAIFGDSRTCRPASTMALREVSFSPVRISRRRSRTMRRSAPARLSL